MNKIIRSLLLQSPQAYKFIHNFKNNNLLNFYLKKVHEPDFKAFKLICDQKPQLFVDIGANVGMSALSFFTLKPNAQVISFEPNPINYPYLDKISNKFVNFQYLKVGLGDRAGILDFYYPVYNGKEMTALGSCNYHQANSWLSDRTVFFFDPQKLEIRKITIEINTLDSYHLQPDFIKIDVEGFEYQVLLGAKQTISNFRPILLIEGVASGDKVAQLLQTWEYNIYKFEQNKFWSNDFNCPNNFFIPQEKTDLIKAYCA
ncbi:hypothetical protein NIES4102_25350 [Chondrocystis sp. NIES-4102]|nr:hypothetical protein NIES4102_25350 [Chondrocystis sp. NIES-4102]